MNGTTLNARTTPTPARTSDVLAVCATPMRRAMTFFAALVGMLAMLGSQVAASAPPSSDAKSGTTESAVSEYASFSQQGSPMDFFREQAKDPTVRIHAAIATVPDPVATRLGRSFDLEIAALISAFEVRDYVLDGFWLTWPLDGKQADDAHSRNEPSVLAFRKDVWRRCAGEQPEPGCANAPAVEYYLLLLVGEAPTFGIHREAFAVAARQAAEFELWSNAFRGPSSSSGGVDSALPGGGEKGAGNPPTSKRVVLKVIGPSFSGSMQSLMNALDGAAEDAKLLAFASEPCPAADTQGKAPPCPRLQAQLHSPSATVLSNANANKHAAQTGSSMELSYRPIATDQCMQLTALFEYLGTTKHLLPKDIAILAEESSFGLGASTCPLPATKAGADPQPPTFLQFPQNIASIRAEHAQLSKNEGSSQSGFSLPSKFLELDMTGVDVGKDLPPPYQPNLSTRSDELVLHQMLDALATFKRPAATIIIATDIRDRLFLLNEIKSALPGTLPVVLEVDNLMVHPDYRQLSRGSVVVGAGDTLVCVDLQPQPGSKKSEISCRPGERHRPSPARCNTKEIFEADHARQYFPFATDYAANTFRAVLRVTEPPAETGAKPECPQLLVATLAGFQSIGDLSTIGIPRDAATLGMLLSSETHADLWRFLMPVVEIASLGFLLIALWLWSDRTGIRVLVPLTRHSIHALGVRVSRCWQWILNHADYVGEAKPGKPTAPEHKQFTAIRLFALALGIVALGGLAAATSRTLGFILIGHDTQPSGAMALLHGRDPMAMLAIAAVFGAVIVISGLRLLIWNGMCRKIADANGVPSVLVERLREGGYFRGMLATAVLLAVVAASADGISATTVDSQPLAILLGIAALGAGTYFLVQLWFQLMRLQQLSREYARAVPIVQRETGQTDWPTPLALGQSPTNPLNLVLFREDLERLRNDDVVSWAQQTVSVICGKWPFKDSPESPAFATWQGYLVAHMKAGAAVLRGCAWAALMAPIAALVMLQVYPAPFERLQTITAIALMGLSFCTVVVTTLRMEKDIMLSRMFTKDADRVSLGEAIGALLPKLLVVLGVLISVFAPDLLSLLPNLSKLLGAAH